MKKIFTRSLCALTLALAMIPCLPLSGLAAEAGKETTEETQAEEIQYKEYPVSTAAEPGAEGDPDSGYRPEGL